MAEKRMVATRAHMGVEIGDLATYKGDGAEYVPGLDAGKFDVWPDEFPAKSPYGHRAISYWTMSELLEFWREWDAEDEENLQHARAIRDDDDRRAAREEALNVRAANRDF